MTTTTEHAHVYVAPKHTHRAHAPGGREWEGDTLAALNRWADEGESFADQNFQGVAEDPVDAETNLDADFVVFGMHSRTPEENNYHYYLEDGAVTARYMTKAELHRQVGIGKDRWSAAEVHRWRRTHHPKSPRPRTYFEHVTRAVEVGIVITAELKSPWFGRQHIAEHLVAVARDAHHPPLFMALWNMRNVRGKAIAIIRAGGGFGVIFGKWKYRRVVARRAIKSWPVQPRIW